MRSPVYRTVLEQNFSGIFFMIYHHQYHRHWHYHQNPHHYPHRLCYQHCAGLWRVPHGLSVKLSAAQEVESGLRFTSSLTSYLSSSSSSLSSLSSSSCLSSSSSSLSSSSYPHHSNPTSKPGPLLKSDLKSGDSYSSERHPFKAQ